MSLCGNKRKTWSPFLNYSLVYSLYAVSLPKLQACYILLDWLESKPWYPPISYLGWGGRHA